MRPLLEALAWWREKVIKPIHGTRIMLPVVLGIPASTYMSFIYPIPVVISGYYVMQWAMQQSEKNIGKDGSKLRAEFPPDPVAEANRASLQDLLAKAKARS